MFAIGIPNVIDRPLVDALDMLEPFASFTLVDVDVRLADLLFDRCVRLLDFSVVVFLGILAWWMFNAEFVLQNQPFALTPFAGMLDYLVEMLPFMPGGLCILGPLSLSRSLDLGSIAAR